MKDASRERPSDRPDPRGDKDALGGGNAFRRIRRRGCTYCSDETLTIDYKDPQGLRYFVTDRGKIVPRRISGACAKHQRSITLAVKRARNIALLPFTSND
jgi:small subunit ribosomal protein S18